MRKMTVGIMGASLGTGNRGVSALGASLVKLTSKASGAQPVMLIGNQNALPFRATAGGTVLTVPVVNYRLSPKSALREHLFWIAFLALVYRFLPLTGLRRVIKQHCPWIRAAAEATVVGDIRGGDSFSDIYGLRDFLVSSLPVMTVIWVRGGIVLFPQTYGPYKHPLARVVARYILRRASVILSRDRESMDTVRQLIGLTDRLRFCPDVAFSLEVAQPSAPEIEPPLPGIRPQRLVGLNVNGLMYHGGYTGRNMFGLKLDYREFLGPLIAALLADESPHLLLVPHTFAPKGNVNSDPQASLEVIQSLPASLRQRVHLVTQEYDQHELKGIIGDCDFFIGSRMHSCIAALSQGVPCVGVAYSKKFAGVFDTVGAADWVIDGRTVDNADAVERILSLYAQREVLRASLKERAGQARTQLTETFAEIMQAAVPNVAHNEDAE